jgi:hypothetical protein
VRRRVAPLQPLLRLRNLGCMTALHPIPELASQV